MGQYFYPKIQRNLDRDKPFVANTQFSVEFYKNGMSTDHRIFGEEVHYETTNQISVRIPDELTTGSWGIKLVTPRNKMGFQSALFTVVSEPVSDPPHTDTTIPSDRNSDTSDTDTSVATDNLDTHEDASDLDTATNVNQNTESEQDTFVPDTVTEVAASDADTTTIIRDTGSENGIDSDTKMDAGDAGFGTDSDALSGIVFDRDALADECRRTYQDALLCSGFDEDISFTIWGAGLVEQSEDVVLSGESSMYAAVFEANNIANIVSPFPPRTAGSIHFRVFVYIPTGTITGRLKLLGLRGVQDERLEMGVDVNIMPEGVIDLFFHEDASRHETEKGVVDEGEWFCLSGGVTLSNDAGTVDIAVNDQEVLNVKNKDTLTPSGISAIDLGIAWIEKGQVEAEVYMDNIVVADVPIPCR